MKKSNRKGCTVDGIKEDFVGKGLECGDKKEGIWRGDRFNACANFSCRMRKAGCRGFEACPGFMSR
jgi:hypothetical protein